MSAFPNRAPIDYNDLRRPYNLVRAVGASVFAIGLLVWMVVNDEPSALVLLIPAGAVAIDAVYRRLNPKATPGPGIVIDAVAIGAALALHGPSTGLFAVAIMTLMVTAGMLLPARQALMIIGFMAAVAFLISVLEADGAVFVGIFGAQGEHEMLSRFVAGVFIASTGWVLVLSVRVMLAAQDRQEEALAQERRAVQLKNEFVSMVSHELRTPLTGIAGFTETLVEAWADLPAREVDEFLAIMEHETDHLSNLVEDILVIPRLEAGQLRLDPVDLDVSAEAHAVASVLFDDSDYSVAVPSGVIVRADRTRLRQIMRNLLENARKYGGDQVLIEGELTGPGLYTVSVSDNGHGVPPDDRERIFEHFEQLSTGDARVQQGVGLGLPIARKLATAMGGELWYEDRFPMGAKFRFSVPISRYHDAPAGSSVPVEASR